MSNIDYTGFTQRKRAAGSQYGSKTAQNAYARFLSQQRGSRKKFDLQQQYEKQAPKVVGGYTQRGVAGPGVQSGIFQKGMNEFASQNLNDINDLNTQLASEQDQFGLLDKQNLADYQDQLAAIEAEKQQQIANTAATLQAFKPFLGG
jgi:hypothetical protein